MQKKKFYKLSNCIKSVSAMQHISRTDFIDKCIWPIKSSSSVKKHLKQSFLSRVSTLTRDIDIAILSAHLSVRPSVRDGPVSDLNGLTYRHSFFHHTVAQSFCFYQHQISSRNSDGVTPCGGAKYRWGITISRFSTNKSLYLANDARYRHSYYGRRIGSRMRSIKWCHFQ